MPACATQGCKSRPRGNDTLCITCKSRDDVSVTDEGQATGGSDASEDVSQKNSQTDVVSSRDVTVVNELLMYTAYHRKGSTRDDLIRMLCSFYKEEQMKDAKDLLWATFSSHNCLGQYVDRRDSVNKLKVQAICEDIYKALGLIEDQPDIHVNYCAVDWSMIPKIAPGSTDDVSTALKLSELEAKFAVICNRIGSLESESQTHGALIHEVDSKTDALKREVLKMSDSSDHDDDDVPSSAQQEADAVPNSESNGVATNTEAAPGTSAAVVESNEERPQDDDGGGPFLRPTHEVRSEKKANRSQQRRLYSQVSKSGGASNSTPNRKGGNAKVVGLASGTGLRSAPMPNRDFFVYRVHKDDGVEKIRAFLNRKKLNLKNIELTSHESAKFNSFKVTVDPKDVDTITNAQFWEKGICIRRWYQKSIES